MLGSVDPYRSIITIHQCSINSCFPAQAMHVTCVGVSGQVQRLSLRHLTGRNSDSNSAIDTGTNEGIDIVCVLIIPTMKKKKYEHLNKDNTSESGIEEKMIWHKMSVDIVDTRGKPRMK